ncbi:MAG: hypothetical protein VXW22_12000 [Pseudomonadota bacterium]|nr:hypothetical protein [Pseudomonadota bacterium]
MKTLVFLIPTLLFSGTPLTSSAAFAQPTDEWLEQHNWEWDCKIVSGHIISNNLATSQITAGKITNLEVGSASLTIEFWSNQDQSGGAYSIMLMPASHGAEESLLITDFDQYGIGDEDLFHANDKYGGIYLRRTQGNEWHGFVSQYKLIEDREKGDQLTTFVRTLECNSIQASQ